MTHITDAMIDAAVSAQDAQRVLLDSFRSFARGQGAMQERIRTEAGGTKISTMAAVMPEQGFAGPKVYTTIKGQFSFAILLFSAVDGRPLASVEANAITRLRTAGCTVLAARRLARAQVRRIGIYGAGVQGRAHAVQLSQAYPLEEIRISDPHAAPAEVLDGADIVVTASRSATPLFAGADIPQGCFIAAIGSSLPHTRELDDVALTRASLIAVDWGPQTRREAGDLVLAGPATGIEGKLVELADLLAGAARGRAHDGEITIYKAVGVALQDVARAGLAYERIAA